MPAPPRLRRRRARRAGRGARARRTGRSGRAPAGRLCGQLRGPPLGGEPGELEDDAVGRREGGDRPAPLAVPRLHPHVPDGDVEGRRPRAGWRAARSRRTGLVEHVADEQPGGARAWRGSCRRPSTAWRSRRSPVPGVQPRRSSSRSSRPAPVPGGSNGGERRRRWPRPSSSGRVSEADGQRAEGRRRLRAGRVVRRRVDGHHRRAS